MKTHAKKEIAKKIFALLDVEGLSVADKSKVLCTAYCQAKLAAKNAKTKQ